MNHYDHIIIGFGKGGKTLAGSFATKGFRVALIERSEQMFGGTCINVACIPSKSLERSARISHHLGGSFAEKAMRYQAAIAQKRELTAALRAKNHQKIVSCGVDVIVGEASFGNDHHLLVKCPDGSVDELWGQNIYINTGARPVMPSISGLSKSAFVYTSETLMELDRLPKRLIIVGGGYIGLEFASYYANFGSEVTIVQDGATFMPREDAEISEAVLKSFEQRGIRLLLEAQALSISDQDNAASVSVRNAAGILELSAEAILIATGRRPDLEALHPERAGILLTQRGAIATDSALMTSVPHIYALGDVTGAQQFTYLSLDDSRIVVSQVLGDKTRTTQNRGAVPYSVFIDPPLSRVGMTQQQAILAGRQVKIARLPAAAIPKALVLSQPDGLLKAVVDAKTDELLGAHLFCAESYEMINLLKLAIDAHLPYTVLKDAIYTHPTMSEGLNELLSAVS